MATVFSSPSEILENVGKDLGTSDWLEVTQDRINTFADATGDHQWIHVDAERAKDGPFGSTIAHGYLTLSLVNFFLPQIVTVENISMGVNYGLDRVRFTSPVPVGSKIRARGQLTKADAMKGGAVQCVVRVTVEVEGSERPACIADTISRFFPPE
jgi:acyl dehydratase